MFACGESAITDPRPINGSVPLDACSFERYLRAGHGRAALDLRDHGLRGHSDLLRRACIRNLAFDPQVECARAAWVIGLLDSVGGPAPWMGDILAALPVTENEHDALQLAQILDLLAERGDERARGVLEEQRRLARFIEVYEDGTDWILGPWPIPIAEEDLQVGPPAPDLPPPTVTDIEALLDGLLQTVDPVERFRLTRPMMRARELPYTPRAVELLAHEQGSIRSTASRLVEKMKDPRMRTEGLRRIRSDGFRGLTASLLMRNLETDDVKILESRLPALDDPFDVHAACGAIAELSAHDRHAGWRRLCLWTYANSPCSNCRSDVVRRLEEMGDVPDELRFEWSLDADETIRESGRRPRGIG